MSELSATELRVLRLAAEGMGVIQMAYESGRAYETIKTQRRQILFKLDARNMPHAVAIGFREGLLE